MKCFTRGYKYYNIIKIIFYFDLDKKICDQIIVEQNRDYFSIYKKQYSNNITILPTWIYKIFSIITMYYCFEFIVVYRDEYPWGIFKILGYTAYIN